jgi:poly(3-hydroxyalkanoate) synthetase
LAPSRPGWPPWNGEAFRQLADALAASRAGAPSPSAELAFAQAVVRDLAAADRALIAGIAAYRRHPYARTLEDPPAIWREGSARLLDYGGDGGVPVLVIPSLVNRAHVLDLAADASFLRWLAAHGARPLLLDHGWPDATERGFTLTDHIAGRLLRAAEATRAACGRAPVLAGYCMGGTMAVAAAALRPELFAGLAALAAPWDFHAPDGGAQGRALAAVAPLVEPLFAFNGTLPVDALQMLFAALDPYAIAEKYRGFATLDPASARAERFVALEDWLNDGVPLAAPVAREALVDWYGRNLPGRGAWHVAGLAVRPQAIRLKGFVAVPQRDRIVPPESAAPLATLLPDAHLHQAAAGHIGMVAGSTAERALWRPFAEWLAKLPLDR